MTAEEDYTLQANETDSFLCHEFCGYSVLDVNGDGVLSPLDAALLIINQMNLVAHGTAITPAGSLPECDVNQDGQLTPLVALMVINALNEATSAVSVNSNVAAIPALATPSNNALVASSSNVRAVTPRSRADSTEAPAFAVAATSASQSKSVHAQTTDAGFGSYSGDVDSCGTVAPPAGVTTMKCS